MTKKEPKIEVQDYEQLTKSIPYLLAGLEGHTNGHKINSIAVQQARFSGYRVVIRGTELHDSRDPVHVVSFTSGSEPAVALLLAEEGYREDLIRWIVDKFKKSVSDNGSSKNERTKLNLTL